MRAFILASGPSTTPEALESVRTQEGLKIATNSTIFAAPWADICYAMDHIWWQQYVHQVKKLDCERWSSSKNCAQFGIQIIKKNPEGAITDGVCGNNSGVQAAEFAYLKGAKEIILLGVDLVDVDGKAHHHSDHPSPLKNKVQTKKWGNDWKRFVKFAKARVINTSPVCELGCFEYADIREI